MPKVRPLSAEEESELDRYLIYAMELVPIVQEIQEEGFLIVATHLLIDNLRDDADLPSGVSVEDAVVWLGVLWGEELCRLSSFGWLYVKLDSGFEGVAIVDENNSRVCFPIHVIHSFVHNKKMTNDCMGLFARLFKGESLSQNAFVVMG